MLLFIQVLHLLYFMFIDKNINLIIKIESYGSVKNNSDFYSNWLCHHAK